MNNMTDNVVEVNWDELQMDDFRFKRGSKAREFFGRVKLTETANPYKVEMKMPSDKSIVRAKYSGVLSNQHLFLVNGYKDYIRVDNKSVENKYLKNLNLNDEIDILITSVDHDNFFIKGSISEIYENMAHQSLKALDDDIAVTAKVKSSTPAGYDLEIVHDGITLSGFMPNTLAGINKLHDPESIVGKTMLVMIESYSREEGTYIVSRRKYLRTLIPEAMKCLSYDYLYTGHVTGTTQFGVFVEFEECLTGMIHKANIQEDWRDRISDIKPGMKIEFYIKEVVKDKIILTQVIRETLWDTIKNGQTLNGVVKDNKQFGTLILLDDETIGLIHTSELEKLNRSFRPEEEVEVKVLAVDRQSRKIFLTLA
jgi:ribosomal protein S1